MTNKREARQWRRLLERRDLWKIGIYKFPTASAIFSSPWPDPIFLLEEDSTRLKRDHQVTLADPFLVVLDNQLYCFYEGKTDFSHGEIFVARMIGDHSWDCRNLAISEEFHLSYPQVFMDHHQAYMIPETARSGQVILYESEGGVYKWRRSATLYEEPLRDPTLVRTTDGYFILGTDSDWNLKLLHSDSLKSTFKDTGIVITNDRSRSRCGGSVINFDNRLLRPAQNCEKEYGSGLSFYSIYEISTGRYSEKSSDLELPKCSGGWYEIGPHHISITSYNGSYYVAIDGRSKDKLLNNVVLGYFKAIQRLT